MASLKQAAVNPLIGGRQIRNTVLVKNLVVMYLFSANIVTTVSDLRDLFVANNGDLGGFVDPTTGSSPITVEDSDKLEEVIANDPDLAPYFEEKIKFRFVAQAKKAGVAAKNSVVKTLKKYW